MIKKTNASRVLLVDEPSASTMEPEQFIVEMLR